MATAPTRTASSARPFVLSSLAVALASVGLPAAPLLPMAVLSGCFCSSWEPPFTEAVSVAKDEASDDLTCRPGDVAASLIATAHSQQATVRAQGCDRTATYDCTVSCGDWSCRRTAR